MTQPPERIVPKGTKFAYPISKCGKVTWPYAVDVDYVLEKAVLLALNENILLGIVRQQKQITDLCGGVDFNPPVRTRLLYSDTAVGICTSAAVI